MFGFKKKSYGNKEKTYYITEDNDNDINLFMDEVIKRKRGSKINEGMQATIVMFDDIVLAKVNEEDGFSSHISTQIELIQKHNYLNNVVLDRIDCLNKLIKDGVESRIICTNEEALITFYSKNRNCSSLETKCIKEVFNHCNDLYKDGHKIMFYINTLDYSLEISDWDDTSYDNGLDFFNKMESDLIRKL